MNTLTPEIHKSIESAFHFVCNPNQKIASYLIRYKGMPFTRSGKAQVFATEGAAKGAILRFIIEIFRHGEYWHAYRGNIKRDTGYDADFSGTIAILPSNGSTAKWNAPSTKKLFKSIQKELLETKTFTIEPISQ